MAEGGRAPVERRAGYRHFLAIPTRWADNDLYGHVNNAVYYAWFDTVINRFLIDEGGLDIQAGAVDRDQAAAAVARIYPAAELVADRYGDFRGFGVPALIADFFFHAGCVLGAPVENWRKLDLATVTGTTSVDGVERLVGRGADVLGHPLDSLAWLANRLAALGRRLEPGAIVMTGSLPLPHWAEAGERVEIALSGIGAVAIEVG